MPIFDPFSGGGDRRSVYPCWYSDPRNDVKRWAYQQTFRPPYPWQTIEEEPDSVRSERESREQLNATRRVFGNGWEWRSDGTVRPTVEQPPITREEEKPQRRSEPEPQQQRAEPTELESTAGHEAHHCLASVCGCTDIESTIEPSRSESGGIRYGHCTYWPPAGGLSLVKDLAISAAGGVWEMMEYGRYINGPDGATVARKLDKAGITDPAEREALIEEAHAYARACIRKNLDAIRQLAQELQENVHKPAKQVRRVQMPMQTRSATVTTSGDAIQICWGSGEKVKRNSFDGPFWENLPPANADLTWMNSGKCPILDSHNNSRVDDVLGVVTAGSAFVRDGKGYASIALGPNAPKAAIDAGTLRNISIGYAVNSMKRNGEAADGLPIYTVESYRILECSIVPVPADKGAEILRTFPAMVRG